MEKTKGKVRRNIWLPHKLNTALMDRALELGIPSNALAVLGIRHAITLPDLLITNRGTLAVENVTTGEVKQVPYRVLRKKFKRRKGDRNYTPPDYIPEDDGTPMPKGIRPLPWEVIKKVGDFLSEHNDRGDGMQYQPKDIARHFKMPMADATVAHDAYVTEFYANQVELIEEKKK